MGKLPGHPNSPAPLCQPVAQSALRAVSDGEDAHRGIDVR
jgi:hypothetical protein